MLGNNTNTVVKYREKEKREEISCDSQITTQLHPVWSNGWKRKRCGFLSCRRHSLLSQEAAPWHVSSPAPSCLHLEDHVQKTQGSPGFCCVWAVPGQQPPFPAWQPLSQPPLLKHAAGEFWFLIQSLCKQCHNLSGAEHDICLMEMLALLWINPNSSSQWGCKTMRQIYYTDRQSSFYYVWNHKK